MMYVVIALIIFIVAVFFIPVKINIYTNLSGKKVQNVDNMGKKNDIVITLKVFKILPIYKYSSKNKENKRKKEQDTDIAHIIKATKKTLNKEKLEFKDLTNKLLKFGKRVKFNKFILVSGVNTEDYVKNAYIVSSLNTIICMFINANAKNFNFKKLYYQVSISDYNYYIALDTSISFSIVSNFDTFITIFKYISNLKMVKKVERKKFVYKNMNKNKSNIYVNINRKYDMT